MKIGNVNNKHNSFGMKYPIINISSSNAFADKVRKSLTTLPDSWEPLLQRNRYKLYCAESL